MNSVISGDHYSDIKCWLKLIHANKKRSKIFYAENEDTFIVDGKLLKLLPDEYVKYSDYDEFYVYVSVSEKTVSFQAWNIENFSEMRKSTIESGNLEWKKIEFSILTFITTNISKLSYSVSSLSGNDKTVRTSESVTTVYPPQTTYAHTAGPYKSANSFYNENDYKERESIRDKAITLIKENKACLAIEHIEKSIIKMCEEKKFGSLDMLVGTMPVDSLNIPVMFSVLKATRGADHLLVDRKSFFDKVKARLSKTGKLNKAAALLSEVEPGKEYVGVLKYNKEPEPELKTNASN